MMVLRDYGTMRLRDVLEPAIGYAENGHPLVERASATIGTVADSSASTGRLRLPIYLPGGKVPAPGTMFTNKRHAETYKRILKEAEAGGGGREAEIERARRAWSQGFVAEAIDALLPQQRGDGCQRTAAPAACSPRRTWRPGCRRVEEPAASRLRQLPRAQAALLDARPRAAADAGPAQGLRLDKCRRPTRSSSTSGPSAPSSPTPTARPSTAIPKFVEVPMETLLSEAYNAERRKLVGDARVDGAAPGHASRATAAGSSSRPRGSWAPAPASRPSRALTPATAPTSVGRDGAVRGDTVHIDVIDKARQHVHRDAVGRLAAILARHSGAGLPARYARADVLAGGRPAGLAGARQAAALDAVGRHGAARRQAVHELGHPRRRPAGPVELPAVPAPRAAQPAPSRG